MSIPVRCQCGKAFAARDDLAGKRVKCPACGGVLQIPSPPALAPLDDDPAGSGRGGLVRRRLGQRAGPCREHPSASAVGQDAQQERRRLGKPNAAVRLRRRGRRSRFCCWSYCWSVPCCFRRRRTSPWRKRHRSPRQPRRRRPPRHPRRRQPPIPLVRPRRRFPPHRRPSLPIPLRHRPRRRSSRLRQKSRPHHPPRQPTSPHRRSAPADPEEGKWRVQPDAPATPVDWPDKMPLNVPVPYGGDTVLYPATPSPFAVIGLNITGGKDVQIWNLLTQKKAGQLQDKVDSGNPVALSPDGRYMAVKSRDSKHPTALELWSFQTGKIEREIECDEAKLRLEMFEFLGSSRLVTYTSGFAGKAFGIASVSGTWPPGTGCTNWCCRTACGGRTSASVPADATWQ